MPDINNPASSIPATGSIGAVVPNPAYSSYGTLDLAIDVTNATGTCFTDTAGTTQATDGQTVVLAKGTNTLLGAVGATSPTLKKALIPGIDALLFASQTMTATGQVSRATSTRVWAGFLKTNGSNQILAADTVNGSQMVVVMDGSGKIVLFAGSSLFDNLAGAGLIDIPTGLTGYTFAVIVGQFNSTSSKIYVNGQKMVTGDAGSNVGVNLKVGSDFGAGSPLGGYITHVLQYNAILTDAQVLALSTQIINQVSSLSPARISTGAVPSLSYIPVETAAGMTQVNPFDFYASSSGALYPHLLCVGAGSEASPYTNADQSAGLATCVARLSSGTRGGNIVVGPYRYDIARTVNVLKSGFALLGDGSGASTDPNGEASGVFGSKLNFITANMIGLGFAAPVSGGGDTPLNGVLLSDLFLQGPNASSSNGFDTSVGFKLATRMDTMVARNIRLNGWGVACVIDPGAAANPIDTGRFTEWVIEGNGAGVRYVQGNGLQYNIWDNCIIADNDGIAIDFQATGSIGCKLQGNSFVRNCRSSGAAQIIWRNDRGQITGNSIEQGGVFQTTSPHYIPEGSPANRAADGINVYGNNNSIDGNTIANHAGAAAAGIRIKSGATGTIIGPNAYTGNTTDVIIESGAVSTVLYLVPGMTYTDAGTGTVIVGATANSRVTGAGTAYSLTTSLAAVVFGTTSPTLSLPPGTYLLTGNLGFSAGTVADNIQGQFFNSTASAGIGVVHNDSVNLAVGTNQADMTMTDIVTLTVTSTVTMRAANVTGARGTVVAANTALTAVRVG